MKERYGAAPTKMRGRKMLTRGEAFSVTLSPRGAYAFAPMLDFFRLRALSGVEVCDGEYYARTLRIGDAIGWVDVRMSEKGFVLTLSENLAPHLRALVSRVRGAFDLDADMVAVDGHLNADSEIKRDIKREPGVRLQGALDGFECAVRAVLGQQVTVIGARTLTERLIERFGASIERAPEGLDRLFPEASALADAGGSAIAKIGMPLKRAETLHRLALASVRGELPLARGAIASGRAALAEIPGIGPWTIEYVAMRALGDPDAYPATDIALINALGRRGETLEHLRPWRAYAAIRLWRRGPTRGARK
jgi:3-methyladenine DNA glycosylase/8-oxoguanine DNA glycosylase